MSVHQMKYAGAELLTAADQSAALHSRRISITELTERTLRKIEDANPELNAFITITGEQALLRAAELDDLRTRGIVAGPLLGIPVGHKDCIFTKGVRTTHGSKIFADFIPDRDARVVTRMRDAGSVMVGKTGLHEFTYGITSVNPHYGPVRNPWDLGRVAGGSSGGSAAAVAAGLIPVATGTDTGGSIRVPASFCGCVGLKPTYKRISREGVMPLGLTLDHVGPLTRTVRDCALAYHAMADIVGGYVPPRDVSVEGLRIALPENFFFDRLEPEVRFAVRNAVQVAGAAGARVTEMRLPDVEPLVAAARLLLLAEASAVLERYVDRREEIGEDVMAMLDQGRLIPATDYINAQRLRRTLALEFSKIWDDFDLMITPATPLVAFPIEQKEVTIGGVTGDPRAETTRLVRPFNILGWPALVLPCGFTTITPGQPVTYAPAGHAGVAGPPSTPLPIGLQLVAAPGREDLLLQAGAALEDLFGLTRRLPGVGSA